MDTIRNFAADIFSIRCTPKPAYSDWRVGKPSDYSEDKYETRLYYRLDELGIPKARGLRQYRLKAQ